MKIMLVELTRRPTHDDVLQMAKAEIRNERFTEDGKTVHYRDMGT